VRKLDISDRLDEPGRWHVHAQVMDLEVGHIEHEADDVLADVVDVALDGADDDLAGGLGRSSLRFELRLDDVADLFEDVAAHDQLGQEILLVLVAFADDHHRLFAGVKDLVGVLPTVKHLLS
jgi:hypothetical protein